MRDRLLLQLVGQRLGARRAQHIDRRIEAMALAQLSQVSGERLERLAFDGIPIDFVGPHGCSVFL